VIAFVMVAFALVPAISYSDTIQVGGTLRFSGNFSPGSFSLFTMDGSFSAEGALDRILIPFGANCVPCGAGDTRSVNGSWAHDDIFGAFTVLEIRLISGSFILPAPTDTPVVFTLPFSLTGFDTREGGFAGIGQATVTYAPRIVTGSGRSVWTLDSALLDLDAPVPEPTSGVLLMTGLAATFLRLRRRLRHDRG